MTVDDWVYEAVDNHGKKGATVREIQRYIDEHHYEELAVDTIETALTDLSKKGRLQQDGTRWQPAQKTTKEDAFKKLFGE